MTRDNVSNEQSVWHSAVAKLSINGGSEDEPAFIAYCALGFLSLTLDEPRKFPLPLLLCMGQSK